jgi:diacylglycerol kinase family enzyme
MKLGRFARRALLRALMGAAVGSLVRGRRLTGALAGAAAGAAIEQPTAGLPLLAAAVATGDPRAAMRGAALGALTTQVWPTAPRTVEELRRNNTKEHVDASSDGAGIVIVVNLGAGSAETDTTAGRIRELLPAAEVVEPAEDDDLDDVLAKAASRATVAIGAAGGDGTLSAAARHAAEHDLVLLALPAGTLNHFARDLGVLEIDDAIEAVRAGEAVRVDVATIGETSFLNTASFGAYTDLVDARERLEDRIGKWPAVAVSLVRVLRTAEPLAIRIDGRERRVWLGFIGAGQYRPAGFAPSWREVLDDGLLDVRIVASDRPFARAKLLVSVLTGQLAQSHVYEQRVAARLDLECRDGAALRIALDGEVRDVETPTRVRKRAQPLFVYAPHR